MVVWADRIGRVLLWGGSLILGTGYFLEWTTDIEEDHHRPTPSWLVT